MVPMTLGDLLRETLDVPDEDVWENERTPMPVRCFAVRLHSMGVVTAVTAVVLRLPDLVTGDGLLDVP